MRDKKIVTNPAEIAEPFALKNFASLEFEHPVEYKDSLRELTELSEIGQMFRTWQLGASLGFVIPKEFDEHDTVSYHRLEDLYFEGELDSYSAISIGKLVDYGAVRALCMTFESGMFVLPAMVEIEPEDRLHVPIMAVTNMSSY